MTGLPTLALYAFVGLAEHVSTYRTIEAWVNARRILSKPSSVGGRDIVIGVGAAWAKAGPFWRRLQQSTRIGQLNHYGVVSFKVFTLDALCGDEHDPDLFGVSWFRP